MDLGQRNNAKYDFNDILIEPSISTNITSRSQVNPFDSNGMLPVFTAPMDTVVDADNKMNFKHNKINICFPRQKTYSQSLGSWCFNSLSLDEFIKTYHKLSCQPEDIHYVLIDIANGHMKKMTDAISKAKSLYGSKLFIMAGNVASPGAYDELSNAGADAVRIGIGNGNGCLTTQQTGIGYPMASLVRECYDHSLMMTGHRALIIADGGMKNYSDIIKALALGADYVMVGSILNKCLESCGETRFLKYIKVNPHSKFTQWAHKKGFKLVKRFRGMSTKEVQKNWGNEVIKTSEGVVRVRPVEYTLSQWAGNFEDYLRSAMSYTNCKTLKDFKGNVKTNLISEQSYTRFNK